MTEQQSSLRRALVTGASEGIGRAFAQRLALDGWLVTCVARNEVRLSQLVAELGAGHDYLVADLSETQGVAIVVQALNTREFDLLINNAGFGLYGKFYRQPLESLDGMLKVNCSALMHLSHAYLNKAKSGNAMINVSSGLAFAPYPTASVYAATKAFVTSLSESLWLEHRKRGVYVMGLCPGMTESEFSSRAGGSAEKRPKGFLVESADTLVNTAMKALKKRKNPTVLSGIHNKIILNLLRLVTRRRLAIMMAKF